MSVFNKLLGVWVVNRTVSSTTPLLMRLLMGMAAVSMVTIFTAFLGAILTATALWFMYHGLLAQGLSAPNALFLVSMLMLLLFFSMLLAMQYYWRKMTTTFRQIVYQQSPVGGRVSTLVDAFMDGFNGKA